MIWEGGGGESKPFLRPGAPHGPFLLGGRVGRAEHCCVPAYPPPQNDNPPAVPIPTAFSSGMGVPSVPAWALAAGTPPPGASTGAAPTAEPSRGPVGRAGRWSAPPPPHRPFPITRRPQAMIHGNFPFKAGLGGEEAEEEEEEDTPSASLAPPALARGSDAQPKTNPGDGARQRLRRLPAPLLALRVCPAPASQPWQETTKCRRPSWPSRLSATRTWRTS